jgi:hypothetical protein
MEIVHVPIENSWKYFHVPRKANEIFPCIKWEKLWKNYPTSKKLTLFSAPLPAIAW